MPVPEAGSFYENVKDFTAAPEAAPMAQPMMAQPMGGYASPLRGMGMPVGAMPSAGFGYAAPYPRFASPAPMRSMSPLPQRPVALGSYTAAPLSPPRTFTTGSLIAAPQAMPVAQPMPMPARAPVYAPSTYAPTTTTRPVTYAPSTYAPTTTTRATGPTRYISHMPSAYPGVSAGFGGRFGGVGLGAAPFGSMAFGMPATPSFTAR